MSKSKKKAAKPLTLNQWRKSALRERKSKIYFVNQLLDIREMVCKVLGRNPNDLFFDDVALVKELVNEYVARDTTTTVKELKSPPDGKGSPKQ